MFRAVYEAASAMTKVTGPDGEEIFSEAFQVNRGVVQGDITSPIYFIIALESILRDYDNFKQKGTIINNTCIHTLGYADDAALIDEDTAMAA